MAFNDEIGALGRAAGDSVDRLATTPAQGVHAAIAERVFGRLGAAALPARALHDGISTAVYAGVRVGVSTGSKAGAMVAKARGTDPEVVSRSERGSQFQAILNGLIGHELALEDDALATQMRHLAPRRAADRRRRSRATPARSSCSSTGCSRPSARGAPPGRTASGCPTTAGRPSTSATTPACRSARTAASWPGCWTRSSRTGRCRSSGSRSSGTRWAAWSPASPAPRSPTWRHHLTHVACLGSPNQGAPLEQVVHRAAGLLSKLPEAAPLGGILDQRSAGIRDLRHGIECGPLLEGVHHLFLGATFTADPKHPIGLVLGDFLVREGSAAGPKDVEVAVDDCVHLGGLNHFHLLNHERVFEHLEQFLGRERVQRRQLSPAVHTG